MRTIERILLAAIGVGLVLAIAAIGSRLGGVAVVLFLTILAAIAFISTALWMGCHEPIQRLTAQRREARDLAEAVAAGRRDSHATERPRDTGQCARIIAAMHGPNPGKPDRVVEAMHGPRAKTAVASGEPAPEPARDADGHSPEDLKRILSRGLKTPVGGEDDVRQCVERLRGPGGAILRASGQLGRKRI